MQLNKVALVSFTPCARANRAHLVLLMRTLAAIFLIGLAWGNAQAKDAFYRCGHDSSYEEIAMAIRNDGNAAEILIRSQNGDRTYYITENHPLELPGRNQKRQRSRGVFVARSSIAFQVSSAFKNGSPMPPSTCW